MKSEQVASITPRIKTGCGWLYTTIITEQTTTNPVFINMGKAGGCSNAYLNCIQALINKLILKGESIESIVKILRGIACHNQSEDALSCVDGIAILFEKALREKVK